MSLDFNTLFVRVSSYPDKDLTRGVSYPMGMDASDSEPHAGLSGYSMARGITGALEALDERMGISGAFYPHGQSRSSKPVTMKVTVFRGREVGAGPDGEELFKPAAVLVSRHTKAFANATDAMTAIIAELATKLRPDEQNEFRLALEEEAAA